MALVSFQNVGVDFYTNNFALVGICQKQHGGIVLQYDTHRIFTWREKMT